MKLFNNHSGLRGLPRFVEGIYWATGLSLTTPFAEGCAGTNNKASPQEQSPKQRCTFSRSVQFSSVQFSPPGRRQIIRREIISSPTSFSSVHRHTMQFSSVHTIIIWTDIQSSVHTFGLDFMGIIFFLRSKFMRAVPGVNHIAWPTGKYLSTHFVHFSSGYIGPNTFCRTLERGHSWAGLTPHICILWC